MGKQNGQKLTKIKWMRKWRAQILYKDTDSLNHGKNTVTKSTQANKIVKNWAPINCYGRNCSLFSNIFSLFFP